MLYIFLGHRQECVRQFQEDCFDKVIEEKYFDCCRDQFSTFFLIVHCKANALWSISCGRMRTEGALICWFGLKSIKNHLLKSFSTIICPSLVPTRTVAFSVIQCISIENGINLSINSRKDTKFQIFNLLLSVDHINYLYHPNYPFYH